MFIRPKGIAKVRLFDTPGLNEVSLDKELGPRSSRSPGSIDKFFSKMDLVQEFESENLLNHMNAAFYFNTLFGGGDISNPYDLAYCCTTNSLFSFIIPTIETSEPVYNDESNEAPAPHDMQWNIGGTASSSARGVKRFNLDSIENYLISEGESGRESIGYRDRWLFLPDQAVSPSIAGFSIYFSSAGQTLESYGERGRVGRVLFRDASGTPIIVNKTSWRTMLLEYTITWMSV